jgi:cytochrome oxidase Cu insertion factor (SCO1/SenC/PrrC family)
VIAAALVALAVASTAAAYVPPAPGSYALPVVDVVRDHPVVDADGRPATLFGLAGDRLSIVAFVYGSCVEAVGCPFSLAALQRIDRALATDPVLRGRVTLIAVSFDPERDTPARMARLRRLYKPKADWRFVTTRDDAELAPMLEDFNQPVARLVDDDGRPSGLYRHVLKVFCLDGAHRVRNVYSVGMLDPDLVLNDLRTLHLERERVTSPAREHVSSP